jgi:hypothetical protein
MSKRPADRPQTAAELGQELQRIQGELGLAVTALPLATPIPPRPPPSSATRQGQDAAPPPPPPPGDVDEVELRPVDDDHDQGQTVTVGRAVPGTDAPTGEPGSDVSTRRVVLGTVAGVVCLLAVAVSLLVFGRGDDDEPATSTVAPMTQVLPVKPPPPQGVTVRPAAEPGAVVVTWQTVGEPGDAMRYQVRPQTGTQPAQNTDQLTITFGDLAEGERPCYTVVAITPDGRASEESALACL